jgi:uncharacterized protein YndB with AHSA1/START domain
MKMPTNIAEQEIQTIKVVKDIEIAAAIEVAFDAILEELGPAGTMPGEKPFSMTIEPWPGGRWYRDLGNNTGHLWGHVQVIKPPILLELCGPMFMSYAATNHLQYRLTAEGNGARLTLTHRSMGQIPEEVRERVGEGWEFMLKKIRDIAERRKETKR